MLTGHLIRVPKPQQSQTVCNISLGSDSKCEQLKVDCDTEYVYLFQGVSVKFNLTEVLQIKCPANCDSLQVSAVLHDRCHFEF